MKTTSTSEQEANNNSQNTNVIPAAGSLGLLALGAVGIKAWRKKRDEENEKLKDQTQKENG
jgi:hypothetical protein